MNIKNQQELSDKKVAVAIDESGSKFLEFQGASKSFDGLKVFEDISFSLAPGLIYGLVGPNACGKTTLLHSAMGLTRLDSGSSSYRGSDVTKLKPYSIARLGLGIVLQNVGVFHRMSVRENVLTGLPARRAWTCGAAGTPSRSVGEHVSWALEQVGLAGEENCMAGSLVPGEQKRLAIARALFSAQDLLLDEPVSGIDSQTRRSLHELFRRLVEGGRSILIVEHDIDFMLETCDEVMFLSSGMIACHGSPEVVRENDEFRNFYLSLKI